MDAITNPVRRARKDVNSEDFPIQQQPDVSLEFDKPLERSVIIDGKTAAEDALQADYLAQLAFNEEPITIVVNTLQEKNPPSVVDCWVNGRGAEVWLNGGWVVMNCIPVDIEVTTKRKYVEVLLGSKVTRVTTEHEDATVEKPRNFARKVTSANVNINILEDKNPKGLEWLRRMRARG